MIQLKGKVPVCNEFEMNSARVLTARGGRLLGAARPRAATSSQTADTGHGGRARASLAVLALG
jgi:hypothetical protein